MAITLTDKDLDDLAKIVEDFRHREAVALLAFLQPRIQAQRVEDAKAKAEIARRTQQNGNGGSSEHKSQQHMTHEFIREQSDRTGEDDIG